MREFGRVDVAKYLFWERSDLLSSAESAAYHITLVREKMESISSDRIRQMLAHRFPEGTLPEAMALLVDGEQAFTERTATRILAEHGEACLNLCPKCQALCRTRVAQQCPRCFFAWHAEHLDIIGEQ